MLRVLSHYLPLRKALLIGSEAVILAAVLVAAFTAHLWRPSAAVLTALAHEIPALSLESALWRCAISAVLLALLAQIAIAFNELYDVRVSSSRYERAGRFVESAGSALALALLALLVGSTPRFGRVADFPGLSLSQRVQVLVFAMLCGFALLYLWRNFFHFLLRRVSFAERVLVLGTGKAARELVEEVRERPDSGFAVVGMIEEREDGGGRLVAPEGLLAALEPGRAAALGARELPEGLAARLRAGALALAEEQREPGRGNGHGAPRLGLYELVLELGVDLVVVALEDRRNRLPTEELLRCRLAGVAVIEQEAIYEQVTGKIAVEAMRPSYLIFNEGFRRHPWTELAKRAIDAALAAVTLLLVWPLMLATAIAVRIDSEGPILFVQERVGRDGRPFPLRKFRSMRADAEKLTGPVWATQDDPRITKVGRFIRRTRLDELPQLFNVLAGDMSLVGPRPERPHFVEDLARQIPYYGQRHIVKPGITGWAQINYPYGNTVEDALRKLQYDLFYVKNQSILFDLSILFNTLKIVILRKGT